MVCVVLVFFFFFFFFGGGGGDKERAATLITKRPARNRETYIEEKERDIANEKESRRGRHNE